MGDSHTGTLPCCVAHDRQLTICLKDLVSRFSGTDPKINVGVLEVAHSIFSRWRPLGKTDELYIEINHVLQTFGEQFFHLLVVRISIPIPF